MSKKLSNLQVQKAFILRGVAGVSELIVDHKNPTILLNKAIDGLREDEVDVAELEALRDTFARSTGGRKGRQPLAIDETRSFRVQAQPVKNKLGEKVGENLFLRLPVELFDVCKGDSLDVTVRIVDGVPVATIQ